MRKGTRQDRHTVAKVYEIIFELSKFFNSECEICLKKMTKARSGFTIHHLIYNPNEKTHRNFLSRLKYYLYLRPIIKKAAKDGTIYQRFAFLCNGCHHSIDGPRGLNRRKRGNVLRLIMMWYRTKT